MSVRSVWFAMLMLAVVGMAIGAAHALELPLASAATASLLEVYGRLRSGWDYGHPLAVAAWFVGVSVLVHSALRTPQPAR
jgi:cbb3-type cytochrome oxidase subunit 1